MTNIKDIYDGIVDAITSFWELITSLIEIFNNFINLIPVPNATFLSHL